MTLWATIASEAAAESSLWEAALRAPQEREELPIFSTLGDSRYALASETIYEGYLLHYGRSRLFDADCGDTAVLLGDYLYAHGLVRLARLGDVDPVADLAELISLCTQLRATGATAPRLDGTAWAATCAALGSGDRALDQARTGLRLAGDAGPLLALATERAGTEPVERALAAHGARVEYDTARG